MYIGTIAWPDAETPLSIVGPFVRADWYKAGEGVCGDYDPDDPEDVELLRFDIYKRNDMESDVWEEVEDASYCTRMPADTPQDVLIRALRMIYKEYANVLDADPEASVKKLGERLSWISPENFKEKKS